MKTKIRARDRVQWESSCPESARAEKKPGSRMLLFSDENSYRVTNTAASGQKHIACPASPQAELLQTWVATVWAYPDF